MKLIETAKEARVLIRSRRDFRMRLGLRPEIEARLARAVPNGAVGVVLETGETVVLVTLIVAVGSVVAYAIYNGYSVRLYREGSRWYLEFRKKASPSTAAANRRDGRPADPYGTTEQHIAASIVRPCRSVRE